MLHSNVWLFEKSTYSQTWSTDRSEYWFWVGEIELGWKLSSKVALSIGELCAELYPPEFPPPPWPPWRYRPRSRRPLRWTWFGLGGKSAPDLLKSFRPEVGYGSDRFRNPRRGPPRPPLWGESVSEYVPLTELSGVRIKSGWRDWLKIKYKSQDVFSFALTFYLSCRTVEFGERR